MTMLVYFLFFLLVKGDFFQNFFGHQRAPEQFDYQSKQLNTDCSQYLCPETFACVASPVDCPCPFPDSQEKCVLDKKNYVCIAKMDKKELRDFKGEVRDCKWVQKHWKQ
ncbi:hypothetical protein HPODL_05169 [Ogataea parapolymorpha DL-1]|uniref:Long chronological lifespan protein 2 n=1 Tax=Ogataea parapolymorpha (strain ATCC 26012 / BCRC 20466 / JCM 22074 / NRRL Y-7560 / DL-1) TaxID=871575 RepID=W1QIF0_OGAPD|nr:hypothetical protein HPODL_05169 [Ogataea parapolymorpha DL-1]ESX01406.1 hypothetical protein HPODL_05169 [Ogataea parapolymorpha DL-1]